MRSFCPIQFFSNGGHRQVTSGLEVTYPLKHSISCIYVSMVGKLYLCEYGRKDMVNHNMKKWQLQSYYACRTLLVKLVASYICYACKDLLLIKGIMQLLLGCFDLGLVDTILQSSKLLILFAVACEVYLFTCLTMVFAHIWKQQML